MRLNATEKEPRLYRNSHREYVAVFLFIMVLLVWNRAFQVICSRSARRTHKFSLLFRLPSVFLSQCGFF